MLISIMSVLFNCWAAWFVTLVFFETVNPLMLILAAINIMFAGSNLDRYIKRLINENIQTK